MQQYSQDASNTAPSATPLKIEFPTTDQEVQAILQHANKTQTPIIPRGTGTGKSGGAVVNIPAIVLSFEKMNHILEIDTQNRIAVVQPGVITQDLQKAAEAHNLFYPPDPASSDRCTIGGNIAENAGGPRALKYGVTANYVTGLAGFYVDGTPFHLGGKLYKNVAGYDLQKLLIGSEGTLAVITKIYLRLIPQPAHTKDLLITFSTLDNAISALKNICTSHIQPAAAEFMDQENQLIIQLDGNHLPSINHEIQTIQKICEQHNALEFHIAKTPQDSQIIWDYRRNMSEALTASAIKKVSHDIVVPPASIGDYLKEAKKIGEKYNLKIVGYGHLGDGNIHLNILQTHPNPAPKFEETTEEILKLAVSMGGSITGEHGIGLSKKPYLSLMFSNKDIEIFKEIKKVLDPNNLLNRGKVVDIQL